MRDAFRSARTRPRRARFAWLGHRSWSQLVGSMASRLDVSELSAFLFFLDVLKQKTARWADGAAASAAAVLSRVLRPARAASRCYHCAETLRRPNAR